MTGMSGFTIGSLKKSLPGAVNVLPTGRPTMSNALNQMRSVRLGNGGSTAIESSLDFPRHHPPPPPPTSPPPVPMAESIAGNTAGSGAPTSSTTIERSSRTVPNPTPKVPSQDERMHLLTLNPREFVKYRPESVAAAGEPSNTSNIIAAGLDNTPTTTTTTNDASTADAVFSGILTIHLLAARGLRSQANQCQFRDLYAVIECERMHKARTVVRSGESSFDWDERFDVELFEVAEISFLLYSWDTQQRHRLCYKGHVRLSALAINRVSSHSLALKMEPKGTLYVKFAYRSLRECFARRPPSSSVSMATGEDKVAVNHPLAPPAQTLFGVPLEQLVARESSGANIPLLIKKCVEQVELRGIGLVGVYRICGSAARKRLLREAFERNCWLVELDAEHVPDINVVTSEYTLFLLLLWAFVFWRPT